MNEAGANERLVRAARELLRWDQKTLAEQSGVGIATVRRFETGAAIGARSAARIAAALRAGGVMFIGAGEAVHGIVEGVALDASGVPLEAPARRVYKPREPRIGAARGRRTIPDPE